MGVCIAKLCALIKVTKHRHQRKTLNTITINAFTSNSKSNSKHTHTHINTKKRTEKKKKVGTNLGNKSIRVYNGRRVNEGRACLL